jgi:hypothetical protein
VDDDHVSHRLVLDRAVARCGPRISFLSSAPRSFRPEKVDAPSVCQGEEVRAERSTAGVESLGMPPEMKEHLLDDLLGQGAFAQKLSGQAMDGSRMASKDLGEGGLVVATDGNHEIGIG